MNAKVKNVPLTVTQFYGLLFYSIYINFLKASKLPYTMIDMGNKIPNFQVSQFFEGQYFSISSCRSKSEFMVSFKDLMISKTGDPGFDIFESLEKWTYLGFEMYLGFHLLQYFIEPLALDFT